MTLVDGREHDFWRVEQTRLGPRWADRPSLSTPGAGRSSHMCWAGKRLRFCSPVHKLLQVAQVDARFAGLERSSGDRTDPPTTARDIPEATVARLPVTCVP